MTVLRIAGALMAFAIVVAPASCDSGVGDESRTGATPCGDGVCQELRCETSIRCPIDCGTCSGTACTPTTSDSGTCGKSCSSSCDCKEGGEVCSADYGFSPGVCQPVACRQCAAGQNCIYTPDAQGHCPTTITCQ